MKRQPVIEIGEDRLIYRQLDRLPGLLLRIVDGFGEPIDLTPFTVELSTRRISGVATSNDGWTVPRQCTIRDPLEGLIFYDIQPDDTNTNPGEFELIAIMLEQGRRVATAPTHPNTFIQVNSNADTDLLVELYLSTNEDVLLTLIDTSFLTTINVSGTHEPPAEASSFMV